MYGFSISLWELGDQSDGSPPRGLESAHTAWNSRERIRELSGAGGTSVGARMESRVYSSFRAGYSNLKRTPRTGKEDTEQMHGLGSCSPTPHVDDDINFSQY